MRQCDKCGESVAEAKAFCPGCGASMDEEAEGVKPEGENLDGTMQFGQTMYNRLISEMGLDLAATPSAEKAPEPPVVAAPVIQKAPEPVRPSAEQIVLKPAARPAAQATVLKPAVAAKQPEPAAVEPKKSNLWKWLIGLAVVLVLLALLIVIAAAAIVFVYLPRAS